MGSAIKIIQIHIVAIFNSENFNSLTICRPDDAVQISLAGKTIDVRTHVFKQRGKKYLGSAYPDL